MQSRRARDGRVGYGDHQVIPQAAGLITNEATIHSDVTDLNPGNDRATLTTARIDRARRALREERRRGPLRRCVKCALDIYFSELNGFTAGSELVLSEVERALFEVALARTRGNLSKTAEILGVSRGTLRKRLKKCGLC